MKKMMLFGMLCISFLLLQSGNIQAEEQITYPFDSIKIVSAFTFDVLIETEPAEESILYGNVGIDEIFTVYVGNLEYVYDGESVLGSESIIILTNEDDEDFVAYLVNSYNSDLTTYQSFSYGSWITIDPEIGIIKDFSGTTIEVGYDKFIETNEFVFIDNLDVEYNMIPNTYLMEESLDILISAYVEVE